MSRLASFVIRCFSLPPSTFISRYLCRCTISRPVKTQPRPLEAISLGLRSLWICWPKMFLADVPKYQMKDYHGIYLVLQYSFMNTSVRFRSQALIVYLGFLVLRLNFASVNFVFSHSNPLVPLTFGYGNCTFFWISAVFTLFSTNSQTVFTTCKFVQFLGCFWTNPQKLVLFTFIMFFIL